MANTVIGSSIVIDGEITGDEDLVIQGTIGKLIHHFRQLPESASFPITPIFSKNAALPGTRFDDFHRLQDFDARLSFMMTQPVYCVVL